MPDQQTTNDATVVWRAGARSRYAAAAISVVLLLLSARVLVAWGYLALIGVLLVLGVVAQTWWLLLRPKLVAGPDGVHVVAGWTPQHLAWKDIRSCRPGKTSFTIVATDGTEVVSRFPVQSKAAADQPTEADAAAAYLAQRAAWERKPTGPAPTYLPPTKPGK